MPISLSQRISEKEITFFNLFRALSIFIPQCAKIKNSWDDFDFPFSVSQITGSLRSAMFVNWIEGAREGFKKISLQSVKENLRFNFEQLVRRLQE